jgi:hypothetical protein
MGFIPKAHQPVQEHSLPALEECRLLLQEAWKLAAEATTRAQTLWQKPSKFQPYKKGDQVWLEGNNLQLTHPMVKLWPKRFSPFEVIEALGPVTYQLALPPTWQLHNAFHTMLLSPYQETSAHSANYSAPAPQLIEGEPE